MTDEEARELTPEAVQRLLGKRRYAELKSMTSAERQAMIRRLDAKLARQNANSPSQTKP